MSLTADGTQTSPARTTDEALQAARVKIENLEAALHSARLIGMAVGVLVERLKLPPDASFAVLVDISQRRNIKLRDIASDLVYTGVLPPP